MTQNTKSTTSLERPPLNASRVRIVEVGPRDGLQNIAEPVSTATKLKLIHGLLDAGLQAVELTSLVSPRTVPQLADSQELLSDPTIKSLQGTASKIRTGNGGVGHLRLPVLVPNARGLQTALELGVQEVAVFVSASEGFSQANIRCSVQEGLDRAGAVAREAISNGLSVRGYVSCIFADISDGPTPQSSVLNCVRRLLDMGCYEISLGDTLGVGVASQVKSLILYLASSGIHVKVLAGHFHDTYGQAVSNAWAAYDCGVRVFDASVAGLGGCPFAPGARGNVATEDLVYSFHEAGIDTGVDLKKLVQTGLWISDTLKKPNGSRAASAIATKLGLSSSPPRAKNTPSCHMKWSMVNEGGNLCIFRSNSHVKIVLNRPENGNVLTVDMCAELTSFFKNISTDSDIRTITITGNGKFFCTGMDLKRDTSPVTKGGSTVDDQFHRLTSLFEAIDNAPQITIACIQGPAFGGGVGLAFVCDIRLMATTAVFTLSEVKLGLCPATISKYLIRELGFAFSREAMLSGRPVGPSELIRIGAVASVQSFSQLNSVLEAYLLRLDGCAPRAASMCKELVKLAWVDAAGKRQAEGIKDLFAEMMAEEGEAAYGVKEFQAGNRSIDWAAYGQRRSKARL